MERLRYDNTVRIPMMVNKSRLHPKQPFLKNRIANQSGNRAVNWCPYREFNLTCGGSFVRISLAVPYPELFALSVSPRATSFSKDAPAT